jgi:hypothetical protein
VREHMLCRCAAERTTGGDDGRRAQFHFIVSRAIHSTA